MALKDWTKWKYSDEGLMYWKKGKAGIDKNAKRIELEQKDNIWILQLINAGYSQVNSEYIEEEIQFKSKPEAIKFANQYMRTH